ncbi:MAG: hypothetical protein WCN95_13535 [bacterium]
MTTIVFTPDGAGHCLYTEAIDLSKLGTLSIKRATTIEFDNKSQYWRVYDNSGVAMYCSPSRETCLEWERQHFNTKLEEA